MKKEERLIFRKIMLGIMRSDPTWNTPCLQLRDEYLVKRLFDVGHPKSRSQIYNCVRKISEQADDKIYEHWREQGMNFENAKSHVKLDHGLPLLIKIRKVGWKEPRLHDLDDDRKEKYHKADKGRKFAKRKRDRVKEVIAQEQKINQMVLNDD